MNDPSDCSEQTKDKRLTCQTSAYMVICPIMAFVVSLTGVKFGMGSYFFRYH